MAVVLLLVPYYAQANHSQGATSSPVPPLAGFNIQRLVQPLSEPDYDKAVLEPLRAAQAHEKLQADQQAALAAEAARQSLVASETVSPTATVNTPNPVGLPVMYTPATTDGLFGSVGYASPFGNCVDEPGINNPGVGNPITWPVLYSEPAIGETALFTYNHVGKIVGMWSNGDLEIDHENWQGASQTRFPRSAFRGYR